MEQYPLTIYFNSEEERNAYQFPKKEIKVEVKEKVKYNSVDLNKMTKANLIKFILEIK